jgi:hypothetical protein
MVIDLTRRLAANPPEPVAHPPSCAPAGDEMPHHVAQRTATCGTCASPSSDLTLRGAPAEWRVVTVRAVGELVRGTRPWGGRNRSGFRFSWK